MFGALARLLQGLFTGFGATVLTSLGIGFMSGAIALIVLNYYIGKIVSQAGFLGDMAAILQLGGFDTAISIVIGATVVRASLAASKLSLGRMKK
ncbi:DUF2523 family protein [Moraxella nonliquefaciens]|uniref:DUF2523 domain-containing protein n=1 Tax=Moraxella nonliquefaciens TaxID=478 RepID=A0A1B8PL65_MORNO|nr:DUF2523 family protein [Moraxella nonliquefaciens]OBX51696.1 hypothetical protein A9Z60_06760 [Moraxella nonliquefaciens]